jgi:hypothetical protein
MALKAESLNTLNNANRPEPTNSSTAAAVSQLPRRFYSSTLPIVSAVVVCS